MSTRPQLHRSVVVIGGSYAGLHAVEVLAQHLPEDWSVTLIERNTHFNHVYSFPRLGVTGNPQRGFIPYTGVFEELKRLKPNKQVIPGLGDVQHAIDRLNMGGSEQATTRTSLNQYRHKIIHATVTKIAEGKVYLDRAVDLGTHPQPTPVTLGCEPAPSTVGSEFATTSDIDSGYASVAGSVHKIETQLHHPLDRKPSIESFSDSHSSQTTNQVEWDFLVYALGSKLPPPLQMPSDRPRTKINGIEFLTRQQSSISQAQRILIVGGGALGIQYATDIAHNNNILCGPPKEVTLIHSRTRFLPNFDSEIDRRVKDALSELGVQVILGQRVDVSQLRKDLEKAQEGSIVVVRSLSEPTKTWKADLVLLCTGQAPNTRLMAEFCPLAVPGGANGSNGLIKVNRALQVSPSVLGPSPVEIKLGVPIVCDCGRGSLEHSEPQAGRSTPVRDRVFAVGDCIDGFGAIKAGHTGWNQAEIASRNIIRLVKTLESGEETSCRYQELEKYHASLPMIKLTLGLNRTVTQLPNPTRPSEMEVKEIITDQGSDEAWRSVWAKKYIKFEDVGDGWA